jgi:cyclopropane fatty-acyl-phospholipid synthase-like methyltransferase
LAEQDRVELNEVIDLAGRTYWDALWSRDAHTFSIDSQDTRAGNFAKVSIQRFLASVFRDQPTAGKKLLEVGCARSAWLPYFAREFGFTVCGIDYSDIGCQQARHVLACAGVQGEIVKANLFDPPPHLLHSQDVVISFGLVEHFLDTAGCLKSLGRLLAPSGLLITIVPNLSGVLGRIQRRLDRRVFDVHVPLTRRQLESAHQAAGLAVIMSSLLMSSHWAVLNVGTWRLGWRRSAVERCISLVTRLSWLAEQKLPALARPNRLTSPYIVVVSRADDEGS